MSSENAKESSEGVLTIEEYIRRYKEIRKTRQRYAIRRFFKIKRGLAGVIILVVLTTLSLLSPIIAPNPDRHVHADLSKPYWMRIFDWNSFDDFRPVDVHFNKPEDIDKITKISTLEINEPTISLESINVDPNDGYFKQGALDISLIDNTSKEVGTLASKYVVYMYFVFKWDKNKPPYRAYFDYARKISVDIPPLLLYQYTLQSNENISWNFTLPIDREIKFSNLITINAEYNISLKIIDSEGNIILYDDNIVGYEEKIVSLNTSRSYTVYVSNLASNQNKISLAIKPNAYNMYNTYVEIYANLYNMQYNRPYTASELRSYLAKYVPVKQVSPDGILSFYEQSLAAFMKTWNDASGRSSPDDMPKRLFTTELYLRPIFMKGNYVVMTIKVTLQLKNDVPEYIVRSYLSSPIKIHVKFDDIVLEVQDEYYGLMGTDGNYRDIFALIIDGVKISLLVGFIATAANILIGVSLGLISGYVGGKIDEVIMRIVDFMMSIPILPLLLVLSFIFLQMQMDPLIAIIFVLSILGWAGMARTIRSQVLALKANIYVEAAKASGASTRYILRKHILPGVWPLVLIYLMQGVVANILAEAGLSFLGVLKPTWHSLGRMIQEAAGISATGAGGGAGMEGWHWIFFPGLILMLIGYAFYAISDAYDEIINPKRRRHF